MDIRRYAQTGYLAGKLISENYFKMFQNNAPPIARQIPALRNPQLKKSDLEELIKIAKNAGATQAAIIKNTNVVFSPALSTPKAADKNMKSEHWPVRYPLDSIKEAVAAFETGIFFCFQGPVNMPAYGQSQIQNSDHRQAYIKAATILTAIESAAFYKSYHLTLGFGAGNCRAVFCYKEKRCMARIKGRACLHPYKARPSMAAVGIDATAMAGNLKIPAKKAMLWGLVMVV